MRRRKVSLKKACTHVRLAGKITAMKRSVRQSQRKKQRKTPCSKSTENSRRSLSLKALPGLTKKMVRCFNAIKVVTTGVSVSPKT